MSKSKPTDHYLVFVADRGGLFNVKIEILDSLMEPLGAFYLPGASLKEDNSVPENILRSRCLRDLNITFTKYKTL